MDSDYSRVGATSPLYFREVEPVAPYPRIDPQQPPTERQPRRQSEPQPEDDEQSRRRFTAMRQLIERLQARFDIRRVDHQTVEAELRDQGFLLLEEELLPQLLLLKIPLETIDWLLQQIRQQEVFPQLLPGRPLSAASLLFPESAPGLREYCLMLENLLLPAKDSYAAELEENLRRQGRYSREANRLLLQVRDQRPLIAARSQAELRLTISVLVAAVEMDDGGRRAILYPRADGSYGLYSDKPVDLSI